MERPHRLKGKRIKVVPSFIYLLLLFICLILALLLTFTDQKEGETSYLSPYLEEQEKISPPPEEPKEKESLEEEKEPPRVLRKNKTAIIIDDMGYNLAALRKIISMKKPLTVSILPFSPYARETALNAHKNDLEVMLHLPLESVNSQDMNSTDGFILSEMSEEETKRIFEENLSKVPYVIGVNNHMGSKITTDAFHMHIILERIKERNLYFVDSLTTKESIAFRLAREMEIPSASREIFLDSVRDENYIEKRLLEFFQRAQEKNNSVAICHPFDETLKVLEKNIHLAEKHNIELVYVSQIVR
jgi:polysaccharide deacetylase 2 family uncharacterized protein YibQ